jgi:hypothetical protein
MGYDRDWMSWNHTPETIIRPRLKGTRIWTLRKDGSELVAGMISRQEYGWEVMVFKNRQLLFAQMFQLRAAADAFATERREEFERAG